MITNYLETIKEKVTERKIAKEELFSWENKKEINLELSEDLETARKLFQKASQITQQKLSIQISKIVTSALSAVFDDPYTFVIDFVQRRNVTECDLLFERNGQRMDPMASCGYGAADIASLALRVAYWKLGNTRNILILDEPTRNLSLDKQPSASMMIKKLSEMPGGLQFIVVTHSEALAGSADKIFHVTQINGVSTIEEV